MTNVDHFAALAAYLEARREAVLEAWRRAADADPTLTAGSALPRTQFRDHVPHLLDGLGRALRALAGGGGAARPVGDLPEGAEHGLQRWQQGYRLREVAREWGHLHRCVEEELEGYASAHPGLGPEVMPAARRAWGELCWHGVADSAAEYHRLQQAEAAGKARDLREALAQLRELGRGRAEALREAAHDLRGNVGVVKTTATILGRAGVPEEVRDHALGMLHKNVAALQDMLNDLMSLARLEAGHERREERPFDAAALLADLCASARPLADERGLYLKADGPEALPVVGDGGKVRRVAQNLLLNALKYTERGGVTVSWGGGGVTDAGRWVLSVRDTGPGFSAGPGAPVAGALEEATAAAHADEAGAAAAGQPAPAAPADGRPVRQQPGEGIGLSIVKRLCELLEATLELESRPGEGSTFRVLVPRAYAAAATPG